MDNLPIEILYMIRKLLGIKERVQLSQLSKYFQKTCFMSQYELASAMMENFPPLRIARKDFCWIDFLIKRTKMYHKYMRIRNYDNNEWCYSIRWMTYTPINIIYCRWDRNFDRFDEFPLNMDDCEKNLESIMEKF